MFSRFFGRKKEAEADQSNAVASGNSNWAFLGADMHSHFIPGIDDGAKTMEDSLKLIQAMADMGYRSIITTPHVMIDFYPNTTEIIQNGLQKVQEAVKEQNIPVTIKAAAEYYIDEYFMERLAKEPLLTIYQNEVLVEFSMLFEPPMLWEVIFQMQQAGYRPIIAHPERYMFYHNSSMKYRELKNRGCMLQMNMLSITGYYGKNIKMAADDLLKKGMYDYCGSDMHHEKHAGLLKSILGSKDYHTFTSYPFLNPRLCF
jgi:protein-tyrosine phosphatase